LGGDDYGGFSLDGTFGLADPAANAEILFYIRTFDPSSAAIEMEHLLFLQLDRLGRGGTMLLTNQTVLIFVPGNTSVSIYICDADHPFLLGLQVQKVNGICGAHSGAEGAIEFAISISSHPYRGPQCLQPAFQEGGLQKPSRGGTYFYAFVTADAPIQEFVLLPRSRRSDEGSF